MLTKQSVNGMMVKPSNETAKFLEKTVRTEGDLNENFVQCDGDRTLKIKQHERGPVINLREYKKYFPDITKKIQASVSKES